MDILFNFICLIHVLIWVFVLLAFLNKNFAAINLYYFIPFIYILHILPFHIIELTKKKMDPETWEEKVSGFNNMLFIPSKFVSLNQYLEKHCYCSPISPQGMLIFGAISSAWSLKLNK